MKHLFTVLTLLIPTNLYSQEVIYGSLSSIKIGDLPTTSALSVFKTGSTEYEVSRVVIGNTTRGSYDSLNLVEFGPNMQVVSYHFFFYTMYTIRREYGTLNYFNTVSPIRLKPNTKYAVYWTSTNPKQGWSFANRQAGGISNTGITFDSNHLVQNGLINIPENLILFLYGSTN